ncbi:MAG: hypothetical protein IJ641_06825 [Lachnospiraceae bacterium]|nr:hypothetical protein [Lachnospiraceae bacterium]
MVLILSAAGLLIFDFSVSDLVSAVSVFIIFIPFYLLGIVKAGDVKLLMLSSMYTGPAGLCSIAGATAAVSLIMVIFISRMNKESLLKTKYPFAFALLLGAFPLWFSGF